jgi:hypothetical protein
MGITAIKMTWALSFSWRNRSFSPENSGIYFSPGYDRDFPVTILQWRSHQKMSFYQGIDMQTCNPARNLSCLPAKNNSDYLFWHRSGFRGRKTGRCLLQGKKSQGNRLRFRPVRHFSDQFLLFSGRKIRTQVSGNMKDS